MRTMPIAVGRLLLLAGLLGGGAVALAPAQERTQDRAQGTVPPPGPKDPSSVEARKAKAAAARKAFEQSRAFYVERQPGAWLDGAYLWSVRLLQAELDLSDRPEDRLAAYRTHLDSMTSIDKLLRRTARFGMTNQFDLAAVEFYRIEAEQWLQREQAGK